MAAKKMKSGSHKVEAFYPKEVRKILGATPQQYKKTFSSRNEAPVAEKDILKKIEKIQLEKHERAFELKVNISFKEFYGQVWLDVYCNDSSGRNRMTPSGQTILNTRDLLCLHILPMFGSYSLFELNTNRGLVLRKLNMKT